MAEYQSAPSLQRILKVKNGGHAISRLDGPYHMECCSNGNHFYHNYQVYKIFLLASGMK